MSKTRLRHDADRIFKINYPSGRIVTYNRDTTGRINQVTTKQNATAASVTLANTIVRQPLSNLVKSFTYGNGTNDFHTFTLDYAIDVLGVFAFACPPPAGRAPRR